MSAIPREELVRRLAEVSHLSYVRQKNRDQGVPLDELSLEVTDHDRERAEDAVAELERLGVYRTPADQASEDRELGTDDPPRPPASEPPPPPERGRRREPVTDIWGTPLSERARRTR